MNKIYLYDGKYLSLLKLIATLLYLNITPYDIKDENNYTPNLIDEVTSLNLDIKDKLFTSLKRKIEPRIFHTTFYVYLSTDERKELTVYYFLKNALKYKNEIYFHRNLNCVNKALKLSSYVSREAHKLKGFIRFKEMKNNFLYAKMSPTNNIISILTLHFKKRLKNEKFLLHDVKRGIYAFYDTKKVFFLSDEDIIKLELDLSLDEEKIEDLWISFFKTIGIKERKNLKTQMNFMPKKYWDYIIEMDDKNENSN